MKNERDDLIAQLRAKARRASKFSKSMADDKSIRNNGHPGDYMWTEVEQTIEWKAADMLESLSPPADEGVEITDAMIEAALHARVPGGAEVWHWLPQTDAFTPALVARTVLRYAIREALSSFNQGGGR